MSDTPMVHAEEEFEKQWTVRLPPDEERRVLATGAPGKFVAKLAYIAATKATAARCVEICESNNVYYTVVRAIKKEFDLE